VQGECDVNRRTAPRPARPRIATPRLSSHGTTSPLPRCPVRLRRGASQRQALARRCPRRRRSRDRPERLDMLRRRAPPPFDHGEREDRTATAVIASHTSATAMQLQDRPNPPASSATSSTCDRRTILFDSRPPKPVVFVPHDPAGTLGRGVSSGSRTIGTSVSRQTRS